MLGIFPFFVYYEDKLQFFHFSLICLKKNVFPHQVAHEVLALEILTLLLESPTDDSAEVAITFLKEVKIHKNV